MDSELAFSGGLERTMALFYFRTVTPVSTVKNL
jgi:hypothetical protein